MMRRFFFTYLVICLVIFCTVMAQQRTTNLVSIKAAFENKDFKSAQNLLQQYIQQLISSGKVDSILPCISLAGEIANELFGKKQGVEEVYKLIEKVKSKNADAGFQSKMYMEAAEYFSKDGNYRQGYDAIRQAMRSITPLADQQPLIMAQLEYNLGVYAQRLANVNLSSMHHRNAISIREKEKNTPDEDLYLSYNAMGAIMWYASKYDSASIFYNKALSLLAKMPSTDVNRYYRPSIIQNNLAGLFGAEGKIAEGIKAMQDCISNSQKFIASPEPHPKKQNALEGLLEGIDNLAGLYKDIGDYMKAGDLLRYSYEQKKQKLNAEHPGIFISEILLGQHYNDIREYDKALHILQSGSEKLKKASGDYLFWYADACYAMAIAYENKKNSKEAAAYYAQSEKLYEKSYQGAYDNIYLQFLRGASLFYANNNAYDRAITMSRKGYDYITKMQGTESLAAFYQVLNLAELSKIAGRYKETRHYSRQGLDIIHRQVSNAKTLIDSVKIQIYQPKAILLNLQAQYILQTTRDTDFLKDLASRLNEALEILKRRRSLIDDEESINILMAEHKDLIEFAKKIELELYQQIQDESHLERFMNLHESAIYNRVRSRLDKAKLIRFAGIPAAISEEENTLRSALSSALQNERGNVMNNYLQELQRWNQFVDKIKTNYPAYYNLRHGSPFLTWETLQASIPGNTTIVRYFFTDSLLHALVIDKNKRSFIALNQTGLSEIINRLLQNNTNAEIQSPLLKQLYQILWQPLSATVQSGRVIIIPDGILFNLSFDLLTPEMATSYLSLTGNSLLAQYAISYHYSLFMLGHHFHPESSYGNYIAFVPGFSDESKKSYLASVTDPVRLDHQYLKLLSQPNTIRSVQNIKDMVGGKTFLNDASTLFAFKQHAGNNKIIHVGTHAEFNNQLPERSRLIFSKSEDASDSNSLFLNEIYNCDVTSQLTILTACESGKPDYQDGEGMISIAHAFNYAGSQSILTGLWKIDEKASSSITQQFVENLNEGMTADEALRNSKINYLRTDKGRVLAPAFWAGLVLIGQTPAFSFGTTPNYHLWLFPAVCALILTGFLIYFFRLRSNTSSR